MQLSHNLRRLGKGKGRDMAARLLAGVAAIYPTLARLPPTRHDPNMTVVRQSVSWVLHWRACHAAMLDAGVLAGSLSSPCSLSQGWGGHGQPSY